MSPTQPNANQLVLEESPSPFICIACRKGHMVPAIEEGDPDYTEHYACSSCGFHDTIPGAAIILSQFLTSILGLMISTYLLITNFMPLLDLQTGASSSLTAYEEIALSTIALAFSAGFLYVMYQSMKGLLHRKSYLKNAYLTN